MRTESKTKNRQESTSANRFIGDYDTVRPLLRYISYGCYHKSFLVERLGQSARAYEENMARLRFFLPEGSLQSSRKGGARSTASKAIPTASPMIFSPTPTASRR